MANITCSLVMPDGAEYAFIGNPYYGENTASYVTGTYNVYINEFTSTSLVPGVKVLVKFTYAYIAGALYLNVSNTGQKRIWFLGQTGNYRNLWSAGQVVEFVYDGTYWQIVSNNTHIWRGAAGGEASTAAKTASVSGFTSANLKDDTMLLLDMPESTAYRPTLNVESTGAYNIVSCVTETDTVYVGAYAAGTYLFVLKTVASNTKYWIMCGYAPLSDNTSLNSSTKYASSKAVMSAYNLAASKYAKPTSGIPASDLASGVIPTNVSSLTNDAGYLTLSTLPVWDGSVT